MIGIRRFRAVCRGTRSGGNPHCCRLLLQASWRTASRIREGFPRVAVAKATFIGGDTPMPHSGQRC